MPRPSPEIRFAVPSRVDATLRYQRYYLLGLDELARVRITDQPALRVVHGTDRQIRFEAQLQRVLRRLRRPQSSAHVGAYTATLDGATVRFAIDAHDARAIRSPALLEQSDVYFKANLWPEDAGDPRIVPIVNGNGMLGGRELGVLRALRDREKEVDVAFISRVWGGREHNLRLFEQVAALPVRSDLHAIFPAGTPADEVDAGARRLRAAGVTVGTDDVPAGELWDRLSRARVVLFRAGKHLCVPWRMIDLLCMGACPVVDAAFGPHWPQPLVPGIHYVDCGLERPEDTSPAPDEQYARVGDTIMRALERADELDRIRQTNAAYFDAHAAPERVAAYVLDRLDARRP